MSLVPAKCTECGGNINIDPEKKAGLCEYCKQPFVVQEAIQNFNTTYNITNNNEIKADVVNVYENKEKDFIVKAGELVSYQGEDINVVLPNIVRSIGRYAFKSIHIETVEIPDSVRWIQPEAFYNCLYLKSLTIHNKELADRMSEKWFANTRPSTVNGNNFNQMLREIQDRLNARYENVRINDLSEMSMEVRLHAKRIIISGNLEQIPAGYFNGNKMEELIVEEGVKEIEEGAFEDCDQLKKVTLPQSIKDYNYFFTRKKNWAGYDYRDPSKSPIVDFDAPYELVVNNISKLKEEFGDEGFLRDYIEKCISSRKCPFCGGALGLFGKCKSCGKKIVW